MFRRSFIKALLFQIIFFILFNNSSSQTPNPDSIPFAPKVDYETGIKPWGIFASDLDEDGDHDLAVANSGPDEPGTGTTISILKNNGDGTFSTKVDYEVGTNPRSIFASDLDGDGDQDLAVANWFSHFVPGTISILKNNGDGIFAPKVDYGTGNNPYKVITSDLDSDGDQDLVTVNYYSNTVSVFKNNGDGTFAARVDYVTGSNPASVSASDLDGDGDQDLVTANFQGYSISVFKNNGNGTFATKIDYGTGGDPNRISLSDLDGDGDSDLAMPNYYQHTLSVLENNGEGVFGVNVDYVTGNNPNDVFGSDLDGDGDQDLCVTNTWSFTVSIFRNNGDGTFASKVDYGAGTNPSHVFAADLDGDTDNDLAVTNVSDNTVSIFINLSCISLPIVLSLTPKSVAENETLSFKVSTYSYCQESLILSATNLPPNSSFIDSGNGSGSFTFTPSYTQSGEYFVTFIACDTVACDSETVQITVNCGNTVRGDATGNEYITVGDVVYLINYLFRHGPPPVIEECNGDLNSSGDITPIDLVMLINFLFREGPPPSPAECCI